MAGAPGGPAMIPARHLPSPEARRRFGDRVDRLGTLYLEADPLADNSTPYGMAQNSRVAVNILVSKSVDGMQ